MLGKHTWSRDVVLITTIIFVVSLLLGFLRPIVFTAVGRLLTLLLTLGMLALNAGSEKLLQVAALILSIVNGLILIRVHVRDRAKLDVSPIHPDVYQWWFRLPDSAFQGVPTRVFGFIAYVAIVNRGYRAVSLERWRLHVRAQNWRRVKLRAISIPEPMLKMGSLNKIYPVLGQSGEIHEGGTYIEAGSGISGMVFYVYECYGGDSWNPRIRNAKIEAHLTIRDVFRGKARCVIAFSERTLQEIEKLIPDITSIPYSGEKQDKSTSAH